MNVTQDLDIFTLILHASIVVKVVMLLLLVVSFMSWMFIFQKWFSIRRALRQAAATRSAGPYVKPAKPYMAVEYWKGGKQLTKDEGWALAAQQLTDHAEGRVK